MGLEEIVVDLVGVKDLGGLEGLLEGKISREDVVKGL